MLGSLPVQADLATRLKPQLLLRLLYEQIPEQWLAKVVTITKWNVYIEFAIQRVRSNVNKK